MHSGFFVLAFLVFCSSVKAFRVFVPAFHVPGFLFRRSGFSFPVFHLPVFHVSGFSVTLTTYNLMQAIVGECMPIHCSSALVFINF